VVLDASSYFDRLWKKSKLVERYFLALKKGTSAAEVAAPFLKVKGKHRDAAAIETTTAVSKKIKFDD